MCERRAGMTKICSPGCDPRDHTHKQAHLHQWRHQHLKSGGARRGQRLIMGGGGKTCARSAHSEREARADFFELLGSDFFFGQTCARSADSERVSASRFWVGSRGPS